MCNTTKNCIAVKNIQYHDIYEIIIEMLIKSTLCRHLLHLLKNGKGHQLRLCILACSNYF